MYDEENQVDVTKLRYVLYVRKSTEEKDRQIRSIEDQIQECEALAFRKGMKIVKTLREEKSARIPHMRVVFNQMLKDIEDGKYDGILCWNPDRLARNMIEGSDILRLIDNGKMQDLKFVTHYFTNDASGKMLLGISFVMADYYSSNLSQNVSRAFRLSFKEGKSAGTPKHGYVRGEDGIYRPDNENGSKNFDLICEAWEMRKNGSSLKEISDYMNNEGYGRLYKEKAKKAGQRVKMSDKTLSGTVFPDPFYYGILFQTDKRIDLREIPEYEFEPATGEETYNIVQSMSDRRVTKSNNRKIFKPLVDMVFCSYCSSKMYPQTPTSGGKDTKRKILSYRCDNEDCTRKNKELGLAQSVRAIEIFKFMYEMLDHLKVSKEDYEKVTAKLKKRNAERSESAKINLHSKQATLKNIERDINDRSLKIISLDQDSEIYKRNEAHIKTQTEKAAELKEEIGKIKEGLVNADETIMSFEDFLNVAKNASRHLKAADVIVKDGIARMIYLNVYVDSEKVVGFQMREPFNTYFETLNIHTGGGAWT